MNIKKNIFHNNTTIAKLLKKYRHEYNNKIKPELYSE